MPTVSFKLAVFYFKEDKMQKKRLFIDMDGTLARFHDEVNYIERMFEKNFFKNLKPFDNLVYAINYITSSTSDIEVFILSAFVTGEPPYCELEKHIWIDRYLPCIDDKHRIFTQMGKAKSEFIPGGISKADFLLDDYNLNLEQWENDGGTSIKCKNNINHKGLIGKLWEGMLIDNSFLPMNIVSHIFKHIELSTQSLFETLDNDSQDFEM